MNVATPPPPWGAASGKEELYRLAAQQLESILEGESHSIAKMATINCVLRDAFPTYFWTGFYLACQGGLVVGPYQGTLGCLRIALGRGVCGTAAETGRTQIVPDVRRFPGHIACDNRSRSEIVAPVFNEAGELMAVFDVDSTEVAAFDEVDARHLDHILGVHFAGRRS